MDLNITNYKEEFIRIYEENITREGSDKLLEWLKKSDFFTAPASGKFHSAHEGGLCEHSVKCYYRFLQNLEMEYAEELEEKISMDKIAVIALLHDICKVDYYKADTRNVKTEKGWETRPYYSINDTLPYGHGEKSVYIASGFMRLHREEAMAINWHMGGFDQRVLGGSYSLSSVYYSYPTAMLFHISDMQATYLDETVDS